MRCRMKTRIGSSGQIRLGWVLVLALLMPAVVMAEPSVPVATPPPLAPVTQPAAVTQNAGNPLNEAQPAGGKILVLPFEAVNAKDANFWLGKSIQQSLQ